MVELRCIGNDAVCAVRNPLDASFTIVAAAAPPEALSPRSGEVVDMAGRDELVFRWKSSAGVSSYRFRLYLIAGGQETQIEDAKVTGTEYVFRDLAKLDVGSFRWTVEPLRPGGEKSQRKVDFRIVLEEAKDKTHVVH